VHSHSVDSWQVNAEWNWCPGSMARRARDNVAPLLQSSTGWMPARIGRLSAGVGRRNLVTVCKALWMAGPKRRVRALRHQTGTQYSTVECTRARVAIRNFVATTPQPEPTKVAPGSRAWLYVIVEKVKTVRTFHKRSGSNQDSNNQSSVYRFRPFDDTFSNVNVKAEHRNAESAQGIIVFPKVNAGNHTLSAFEPAIKNNLVHKLSVG